ncbi:MAG: DUF434 domain-containing protein [Thermoprotei archaeon]|nr:MAG: DUF434 domain-containing protein [Thermoprotei archaeon]
MNTIEYSKALIREDLLYTAALDFKYLLNKGFRRETALRFVGDRYGLSKIERAVLYRSIFSDADIRNRRLKSTPIHKVRGNTLVVDGFNVITTIESALRGELLILCEDEFIRDITSVFRKIRITPLTYEVVDLLLEYAKFELKVEGINIVLNSQVSRSGELSGYIRHIMKALNLKGTAKTSRSADVGLREFSGIVASSDSVVISYASKVFDLGGSVAIMVAELVGDENILDMRRLLNIRG